LIDTVTGLTRCPADIYIDGAGVIGPAAGIPKLKGIVARIMTAGGWGWKRHKLE
jgi:hypothetical protein